MSTMLATGTDPHPRQQVLRAGAALLSGVVFGLGLAVAQMVDPLKVLGFLDVTGAWNPSLLLVLGGAVVVASAGIHLALRRPAPVLGGPFPSRPGTAIDARLLAGAAIFGIGWGLAGYCPGPAIASLGFGNAEALWFVPALVAGAGLQRWQTRRGAGPQADAPLRAPTNQ